MSRHGKEAEKQAHSYVDGVPVKISEKYKPPRKITLPVGYQHRLPATAVSEEYDFSLEHSILQKMVEWQKIQQNASEERQQRIKLAELTVNERVPKVDKNSQHVHTGGGTAVVDTGGASTSLSKSVPDIMQELDRELREKRRGVTPPATSALRPASIGSTGLENWKPWPDLDSPEQLGAMRHHLQQRLICALPDPFPELNLQEQKFAKHISEMGFPLPRVARVTQLLGEDDKKVVEFLLQVQCFEEKGYPADRAERALTVNECSFEEAEKCLIATGQLLDLGFPEDKVAEALARSNNNRDQALEYLIS